MHGKLVTKNIFDMFLIINMMVYIPITNPVRGPYCKLQTEFSPFRFMAQVQSTPAINRRRKTEDL